MRVVSKYNFLLAPSIGVCIVSQKLLWKIDRTRACKEEDIETNKSRKKMAESRTANQTIWRSFSMPHIRVREIWFRPCESSYHGKFQSSFYFLSIHLVHCLNIGTCVCVCVHLYTQTYNGDARLRATSVRARVFHLSFSRFFSGVYALADKPHIERRFDSDRTYQTLSLGCTFRQFTNRITWKINIIYSMRTEIRRKKSFGGGRGHNRE